MSDAKVRTCLWFDGNGEEAARFWTGLVPGSEIEDVSRPTPDAPALIVTFRLAGTPYMVLNGGPHFTHSPAVSISVTTDDQAETDRLWEALTADGGEESQCGWLVDRFGVSWQIVPRALHGYIGGPDADGAERARQAMFQMRKIDIAALERAYVGEG